MSPLLRWGRWGVVLAAFHALTPPALASAPLRREVLVVYNGAEGTNLRGQTLPSAVEVVLNHLGLLVRYQDLALGLPDAALSQRVRGVVSLVAGDQVPWAAAYADWLRDRLKADQSIVLLGGLGFLVDSRTGQGVDRDRWAPILKALGVTYDGDFVGDPSRLAFDQVAPPIGFERPWREPPPSWVLAKDEDPRTSVFLRIRRTDTGQLSDMGVLGPHGAVLLGMDYLYFVNPFSHRMQWRLDPFWLLGRGLRVEGEPHLDTTTVNGRRVFYSHIDGDGFANVANVPGRPFSAEVIRDQVLKRTPLPVTASIIARELAGHPRLEAIGRSIFRLPNVEAASHTYTHPFDLEGHSKPVDDSDMTDAERADAKRARRSLDPELETIGSVRYIQGLLPRGKRVELILWPGMTNPTEAYFKSLSKLGIPNLNGGDAMVNEGAPSYTNLSPLARQVGGYLQVYNSVTNENNFTNLWTGPFDGQRRVFDTFRFAGAPRRLAPVNLYYHFYGGEHVGATRVLQDVYRWAEHEPLAPLFASSYARMVEGFFTGEIQPDGPAAWWIRANGRCRTVRFDAETRGPDLARSVGVLGYNRSNGALYVHLAPGPCRVELGSTPSPRPYLLEANAAVVTAELGDRLWSATFDATIPLAATFSGLRPHQVVTVSGHGAMQADADGVLRATAPKGESRVEVRW